MSEFIPTERPDFDGLMDWLNEHKTSFIEGLHDEDEDPLNPEDFMVTGYCIHIRCANMPDGALEDRVVTLHHKMSLTEAIGAAYRFAADR